MHKLLVSLPQAPSLATTAIYSLSGYTLQAVLHDMRAPVSQRNPARGGASRSGRPSAHLLYLDSLAEVRAWLDLLREDLLRFVRAEEERNYPRVIARAKRFVEQHHAEELTLAMVAKDAALDPSYFSTLFKHHSGEGFTSYLTRVRIEAAKELLRTTDLKVYEVAERVGYQNQYHFSRVFKRMTGLTPGEFRSSCG